MMREDNTAQHDKDSLHDGLRCWLEEEEGEEEEGGEVCVWRSDILLDDGGHDVVELEEGLDVDGQAGAPVAGLWVEAEPGQGVVTLQHVPTHDSRQLVVANVGLWCQICNEGFF